MRDGEPMISRFRTFIAGFLVLLPLAVTLTVIVWVGTLHLRLSRSGQRDRPRTDLDRLQLLEFPIAAYALGAVVVVGLVYLLGLVVEIPPRKPGAQSDRSR